MCLCRRLVQKVAECKTSYDLGWEVSLMKSSNIALLPASSLSLPLAVVLPYPQRVEHTAIFSRLPMWKVSAIGNPLFPFFVLSFPPVTCFLYELTFFFRVFVWRQIHPEELVVGDVVVMKPGDGIPADGLLFAGEGVKSNESGLTGEPDDLTKRADADCFLYSRYLLLHLRLITHFHLMTTRFQLLKLSFSNSKCFVPMSGLRC